MARANEPHLPVCNYQCRDHTAGTGTRVNSGQIARSIDSATTYVIKSRVALTLRPSLYFDTERCDGHVLRPDCCWLLGRVVQSRPQPRVNRLNPRLIASFGIGSCRSRNQSDAIHRSGSWSAPPNCVIFFSTPPQAMELWKCNSAKRVKRPYVVLAIGNACVF